MYRIATIALTLLAPAHAAAQGVSVSTFLSSDRGLSGQPDLVGLTGTLWLAPVGVRVGGAVDAGYSPVAPVLGLPPASDPMAWSGDVDLVVPGRSLGLEVGSLEPSVFAGIGVHGLRRVDGSTATIPTWSYGGGGSLGLASWLSVEAEARYRMPHESDARLLPSGVGGGWEMRAGLSLHMGRTASRPRVVASGARTIRMGGSGHRSEVPSPGASATAVARSTLVTADGYVGVPYVWGGDTPSEGFDCSGFVRYVFARNGVSLPRVSRDQARAGTPLPVRRSALSPGDLMFFAGSDGVIDHVAIYVGDGRIIHSSGSRGAVGYDHLDSRRGRWYDTHFVEARRVIPDGSFRLVLPGGV